MSATVSKIPFVDLGAQFGAIGPEIERAVLESLKAGDYILGAKVAQFEKEFAAYLGCRHAIGVSSGLDALRLALVAAGVGPGDEVVVPASTFIATALAVSALGATPRLVDCDATGNLDPKLLESALMKKVKAVIPVHLAGQPADLEPLLALCTKKGLPLIEDAAQAHGARYKGRRVGGFGASGAFSFYPGKNLGAAGDAGAIVTDDDATAERVRRLRNYGQRVKYEHVEQGLNARLDTVQAAVLSVKLAKLDAWNEARARHAARYRELLAGVGDIQFPPPQPGATHVYHLFTVETDRRDALRERLLAAGVEALIHYPIPIHLQEAYRGLGHKAGDFPVSERRARRTLSLPMFAELGDAQIERVVAGIKGFFGR